MFSIPPFSCFCGSVLVSCSNLCVSSTENAVKNRFHSSKFKKKLIEVEQQKKKINQELLKIALGALAVAVAVVPSPVSAVPLPAVSLPAVPLPAVPTLAAVSKLTAVPKLAAVSPVEEGILAPSTTAGNS